VQQEEKKRLTCLESYLHGQRDEPALLLDEINCTLSSSTKTVYELHNIWKEGASVGFFLLLFFLPPNSVLLRFGFPVVVVVAVAS